MATRLHQSWIGRLGIDGGPLLRDAGLGVAPGHDYQLGLHGGLKGIP